ncbi:hypothetical protein ACQPXT_35675 [Streptomyces sp. CA-100214]
MGRLLLIWRLAVRDMRRRPGESVMFVVAVTAAIASLTLGLSTNDAVTTAYLKTREATEGPDIVAITTAKDPSGLAGRLERTPGWPSRPIRSSPSRPRSGRTATPRAPRSRRAVTNRPRSTSRW